MLVFDLNLHCKEWFFSLTVVRTSLANELISEYSLEKILDDFLFIFAFNEILNFVNHHGKEFFHISLNHRVDWLTINVFESTAELLRIVVLLFYL